MSRASSRPLAIARNDASPHAVVQRLQQKRFEEAFNKLVFAVEAFSLAYNQNKGQTWPSDKAAALRKAMSDLQKIDPNFKMPPVLDAKR